MVDMESLSLILEAKGAIQEAIHYREKALEICTMLGHPNTEMNQKKLAKLTQQFSEKQ